MSIRHNQMIFIRQAVESYSRSKKAKYWFSYTSLDEYYSIAEAQDKSYSPSGSHKYMYLYYSHTESQSCSHMGTYIYDS
jgi:hypothetical protein